MYTKERNRLLMPLSEYAERIGVPHEAAYARYRRGTLGVPVVQERPGTALMVVVSDDSNPRVAMDDQARPLTLADIAAHPDLMNTEVGVSEDGRLVLLAPTH